MAAERDGRTREQGPRVLVIEDVRTFRFACIYARTVAEARPLLFEHPWNEVWFDHDMAMTMEEWEASEGTVMPLVNEMERLAHEGTILPIGRIFVHTANPMGGVAIMQALSRWYHCTRVSANDYIATDSPSLIWVGPQGGG